MDCLSRQDRGIHSGTYTEAVRLSGIVIEYLKHFQKDDPNTEKELLKVGAWIDSILVEIRKLRHVRMAK